MNVRQRPPYTTLAFVDPTMQRIVWLGPLKKLCFAAWWLRYLNDAAPFDAFGVDQQGTRVFGFFEMIDCFRRNAVRAFSNGVPNLLVT